jgi:tRNA-specific 2-thiouridylase
MKKRVVVGMSGGVDSSVAAWLLKEQGYEVIGVTMQIWQSEEQAQMENEGGCCGLSAVDDARRVAGVLDIPYYVMNFRDVFREQVIDPFMEAYKHGHTPNPCILCNRYVKWEALLHRSLEIGADYIATGHYARIARLPNGRFAITSSATATKDQTYALYNLTQEQLSHTLMPVGDYTKEEIRAIAMREGLPVAHKPDSQEICFVPDQDYAGYIENNSDYTSHPGCFVDLQGHVLGQHKGIIHYTVGQRKGLGIAFGHPMYVVHISPENNEVVLGEGDSVFCDTLYAGDINYMGQTAFAPGERVLAKIRYSHAGDFCRLYPEKDGFKCVFERPQRAITPGQAVVFYRDGAVLGGGTILGDGRFMGAQNGDE